MIIDFSESEKKTIETLGQIAHPLKNPADSDSVIENSLDASKPNESSSSSVQSISNTKEIVEIPKPKGLRQASDEIIELRRIEHGLKVELLQAKLKLTQLSGYPFDRNFSSLIYLFVRILWFEIIFK